MPTAKASTTQYSGAVVWGSESAGSYDPTIGTSWRKSNIEVSDQRYIAPQIANGFANSGYTAYNYQGNNFGGGSLRSSILTNLTMFGAYYSHLAVVDFDHGVGDAPDPSSYSIQNCYFTSPYVFPVSPAIAPADEYHFHIEDELGTNTGYYNATLYQNTVHRRELYLGNAVYDTDIYQATSPVDNICIHKHLHVCLYYCSIFVLALLSAVAQGIIPGTNRAEGMPFAFTHRWVEPRWTSGFNIDSDWGHYGSVGDISSDGYNYPDSGSQVYVGFQYGSASLSQTISPQTVPDQPYETWVQNFFQVALNTGYPETVNQALDTASLETLGIYFGGCQLHTGFPSYWWMYPGNSDTYTSTLAVYGNGYILIQNTPPSGFPPLPTPTLTYPNPAYSCSDTSFTVVTTDPYGRDVYYTIDWNDAYSRQTVGPFPSGVPETIFHLYGNGGYNVVVSAEDTAGLISARSLPYYVDVESPPPPPDPIIYINAIGYDGNCYYPFSVNAYIDYSLVGSTGNGYTVTAGTHDVEFDSYIIYYEWPSILTLNYVDQDPVTVPPPATVTGYYWIQWLG